ncbi:MAG: ribosome-associated protein [Oleiphilus sp.]|nr:MAG: ribosome-associated protein [Oleiphilus sp.]
MSEFTPDHDNEDLEPVKSKSQIKREMEALQGIGKKLTELNETQLTEIPMGEELRHAIDLYRHRITKREARRRHLQFIGKLMRSEDIEGIQAALDKYDSSSKAFAQALHALEAWRTRLINEGNEAVTEFIEAYPQTDVQQLRQLVRNAKREQSQDQNKGGSKKLFQFLRQISEAH